MIVGVVVSDRCISWHRFRISTLMTRGTQLAVTVTNNKVMHIMGEWSSRSNIFLHWLWILIDERQRNRWINSAASTLCTETSSSCNVSNVEALATIDRKSTRLDTIYDDSLLPSSTVCRIQLHLANTLYLVGDIVVKWWGLVLPRGNYQRKHWWRTEYSVIFRLSVWPSSATWNNNTNTTRRPTVLDGAPLSHAPDCSKHTVS